MRATWQIFKLLLFDGFRIQRWLVAFSLVVLLIGAVSTPLGARMGFGIYGLLVLLLVPALLGGVLLRRISAPRITRLIPHGRQQILLGIFLSTVAIAGLVTFVVWFLGMDPPPPTPLLPVFALAFLLASLLLLGMFVACTSVGPLTLWSCTLAVIPIALGKLMRAQLVTAETFTVERVLVSAAVLWLVFGIWYLRARTIDPGNAVGPGGSATVRIKTHTRAAAFTAMLLGYPTLKAVTFSGIVGVVGLVTFAGLIHVLSPQPIGPKYGFLGLAFVMPLFAGFGGFITAGNSRLLWLKAGRDRAQLFRVCEKQAWLYFLATNALVPLALLASLWLMPEQSRDLLFTFACFLALGIGVLYLGLMHVTGWRVIDVVLAILFVAAGLAVMWTNTLPLEPVLMIPLLAGLVAFILLLRAFARRRWQQLDWLVCKRPASNWLPRTQNS